MRNWSGTITGLACVRSTVFFGRGGKADCETVLEDFWAILCALHTSAYDSFASVVSLRISVSRLYLGQILSFAQ